MANNHQGSVGHGKRIVRAMREVSLPYAGRYRFAVKFQYRDLDTFIHPGARGRADIKNVKRFEDTRLSPGEFARLLASVRESGFLAVCTPFDEVSAARMPEEGYDYVKIASCSFDDWPLLEAVAATRLPVIASAAGSGLETIRKVVSFFAHRRLPFALMHCVGEYPTPGDRLQMNQLDLFRREFPDVTVGFSTHEAPDSADPVKLAVAKGARIFEKHVGVPIDGAGLNAYSANPAQVGAWLAAADAAFAMCGGTGGRCAPGEREEADLAALRRGVFVKAERIAAGEELNAGNMYFAFPCRPGQLVSRDFSKYVRIAANRSLARDDAVMLADATVDASRQRMVTEYVSRIVLLLERSGVMVPIDSSCEISHHYGLERYPEIGLALIDCVNREYCKKILVLLPGQRHPSHRHVRKEETFLVVYGDLTVRYGDGERTMARGESMVMERSVPHSFYSANGCVFEEISSTHFAGDSFYENQDGFAVPRKTTVFLTRSMLDRRAPDDSRR
ncbi:MAG: N-acetylneuraminate synthase family protein [Planctomycetota bacterium]|nr:N-acetylneuraminate synthase family protein [Planctomycetota bacterium]